SSFFYEKVTRFCRRESLTSGDAWHWLPAPRKSDAAASPRTRLVLLTDRPEEERRELLAQSPQPSGPIWTRDDLRSPEGGRALLRKLREIPESNLEIRSEDLHWHEQVIRVHLMGALARSRTGRLRDRRGREENLGWAPLLLRQAPAFLSGSL